MHVGIVCGYDLDDDLDTYVTSVAPLIADAGVDVLVVSGGRTSPRSHHSEAWVISQRLAEITPQPNVMLEEEAMTTLENLVLARGLAEEEHGGAIERFTVFCDHVHHSKVRTLARLILGAKTIVRSVERAVPLRIRLFEPVSHVAETAAALVPSLRKYLRAVAMRFKGLRERR